MGGPGSDGGGRGRRRAFLLFAALALLLLVGGVAVRWSLDGADDEESVGGTDGARGADGSEADPSGDATAGSGSGSARTAGTGDSRSSTDGTRRARPPTNESGAADGEPQRPDEDSSRGAGAGRTARPDARPRSTLVGEEGAHPNRRFGEDVAIDGDVAVIAAPGFQIDGRTCGAVYVYERREEVWTQTQRLDAPRTDLYGFAAHVGVAGGRIVVFGGAAKFSNRPVFRSYVRGDDGLWTEEAEVEVTQVGLDAAFRGSTAVIARWGAVDVFEVEDGVWRLAQTIDPPEGILRPRFARWLSFAGDTLVVESSPGGTTNRGWLHVYRRQEGRFAEETVLLDGDPDETDWGTLARDGSAFVGRSPSRDVLTIDERTDSGWRRSEATGLEAHGLGGLKGGRHETAADGDLVVATDWLWNGGRSARIAVIAFRGAAWHVAWIDLPPDRRVFRQLAVALSGRTAVHGCSEFPWGDNSGGRAWFVEITDEDLAHAKPLELVPAPSKAGPEERSFPVR